MFWVLLLELLVDIASHDRHTQLGVECLRKITVPTCSNLVEHHWHPDAPLNQLGSCFEYSFQLSIQDPQTL